MEEEEIRAVLVELKASVETRDERHAAKIQALETQLKQFEAKSNRAALFGGRGTGEEQSSGARMERSGSRIDEGERKQLETFIRTGQVEQKAMTVASGTEGGYLAPPQFASEVVRLGAEQGAVRQLARNYTSRTGDFHIPVIGTAGAAWIGESGTRAPTANPPVMRVHPSPGSVYGVVPISNHLLMDSGYPVAELVLESIAEQMGALEAAAFVVGDSITKPMGFLSNPQAELGDATRTFGTVEKYKAGSETVISVDALISLRGKLAPRFRKDAAWIMHPTTQDYLRTLRTAVDGPYAWLPSLAEASPDLLLGNPVLLDVNMPEIAAGAIAIGIASWPAFYATVDVGDMTLIRDNVTSRGSTIFYAERRVAGAVVNSNAGKLLIVERVRKAPARDLDLARGAVSARQVPRGAACRVLAFFVTTCGEVT